MALLGACGGDAARVLGPTTYDVTGDWRFDQQIENAGLNLICGSAALLTVVQDGPRFTAAGLHSGYCAGPGGTENFVNQPFAIADGTIDGSAIAFTADECTYRGTAHGAKPDSVAGSATCRIQIGVSTATLAGTFRVVPPPDTIPPTVTATVFGGGRNDTLEAGDDTIYIHFVASDDAALRAIGYEIRDPSRFETIRRDSLVLAANDVVALDDTLIFPLPLQLILPFPDGAAYEGTYFARDTAGHTTSGLLPPMTVRLPQHPIATGSVTGSTRPDSTGALRDTLEISVAVTSRRALRYIGYRLTSFLSRGDSIAVTDTAASHTFKLPVEFAWKSMLLRIEVFGHDRLGLEDHEQVAELRVVVFPSRPTQTFRVGQGVGDVLHDVGRDRVYLSTATDSGPGSGSPEIRVLQLDAAGASYLPGIAVPWFAGGMDLSLGGDTLFIAADTRLGFVHLPTLTVDSTAPIAFTPGNRAPWRLRVMANNKAMIAIASAGPGAGQIVELDLGTGTQTLRTDAGAAADGNIGLTPLIGGTADRTRLVVYPSSPTASEAQSYESGTNTFGASVAVPVPPVGGRVLSGDAAGTRWLLGNQLFDGNLAFLRQLGGGSNSYAANSVLSPDGAYAYVAVAEGVGKFRTSDGVRDELILLQEPPYHLRVTPDGNTLIVVGFGLQVVDLR